MEPTFAYAIFAASNDAKCVHLNSVGPQFDRIHKIAGDIYDELAEDADLFAEISRECNFTIQNPNCAASIIGWEPVAGIDYCYDLGIGALITVLEKLLAMAYLLVQTETDEGVKNALGDFIQKWQKELRFKLYHRR